MNYFANIEPGLMTDIEAAMYLRLVDSEHEAKKGVRAINYLVTQGKIRPCLAGGKRRYARRELDRFIDVETEKY